MNSAAADTATFQPGNTYGTRSACDWDTIFSYTVISRTAKFITIENMWGETKRVGITVTDGVERAKPEGTYSMCPVISADNSGI